MKKQRNHRIHPKVRQRARELRQTQTPAEKKIWRVLRNRNLCSYKFRRQHPIGRFIVDFYCAQAKLVIEIDGASHGDQEEYDQARTQWLNERGYTVIRFTNQDVKDRLENVAEKIVAVCQNLIPSPHGGEG